MLEQPDGSTRNNLALVTWAIACLILLSGCDTSNTTSSSKSPRAFLTTSAKTPQQLLDASLQRYRQLSSYEDTATVELQYRLGGELTVDKAPLSVAYEAPNRLGVNAYELHAWTNDNRFEAIIGGPRSYPFENQFVQRRASDGIRPEWFNDDPVLAESLSAGLAGAPVQLALLFGDEPFRSIFGDSTKISMSAEKQIDRTICDGVEVDAAGNRFVFWLSQSTGLIRRIELPMSFLPPEILENKAVSDIRLTIELTDAQINRPIAWDRWMQPLPESAFAVRKLVPPPAPLSSELLGSEIDRFEFQSLRENRAYSAENESGSIRLLVWLADHPGSFELAKQLDELRTTIDQKKWKIPVSILPIWAEANPPGGVAWDELESKWKLPSPLMLDRKAHGRDLFHVHEAPTVVVLDRNNRLQWVHERANQEFAALALKVLADLQAGVDLASEARAAYENDRSRYGAELRIAASEMAEIDLLPQPTPYPPLFMKNLDAWTLNGKSPIVAIGKSSTSILAVDRDATLKEIDPKGNVKRETKIQGVELDSGNRWILRCSSNSPTQIALGSQDDSRIAIGEISTNRWRTITLDKAESIVDMVWTKPENGDGNDLLAALTTAKRVLLIDPSSGRVSTGKSEFMPVAFLPRTVENASELVWQIAVSNGDIEPLFSAQLRSLTPDAKSAFQSASIAVRSDVSARSPSHLDFTPEYGPWAWGSSPAGELFAGFGRRVDGESNLIVMDRQLQRLWQYPIAMRRRATRGPSLCSAVNSQDQSLYWGVLSPETTLHLIRADGVFADHFSLGKACSAMELFSDGDSMLVIAAVGDQLRAIDCQLPETDSASRVTSP